MRHPTLPTAAPNFRRHIHKTLDLAMQIPVRLVPAVLTPLAREDALLRRSRGHWRDGRVSDQRELARFVQPGAAAGARGEELVLERGVDYPDDRVLVDEKADGDAEHGEDMSVVYRS